MSDFLKRVAKLPAERLALLAAELKERLDQAEGRLARREEPIAIIGMGCRFPGGADDPELYWSMLRDGREGVRDVPSERWDASWFLDPDPDAPGKMITCRGGFLDTVDQFDARFFGIAPREAINIDPQHRLLLEVTWEALEDSGIAADRVENAAGGVFIGLCNKDYASLMMERPLESIDTYSSAGAAGSMAAGRIAYLLGISGPAFTVDTACSSSLVALHLACESLRNGECEFAITGGANLILGVESMIALSRAQMLSPDGRCSTFDEKANGIVRGEGCGVIVLKRLADARADGDRIHALIRATGINQDGRSSGITAPNGSAQEALMRATLERCGLAPGDVDYIEAHGTGTRLGDPIEVRALGAVYGARARAKPLRLGSVKTNIGHLEAAAGIAGVLKAVLAMRARQIPPHLNLNKRNSLIEWDRWPLEVVTDLQDWDVRAADGRRRAAVSSFGFSGTNAHAILEEAPPVGVAPADDGREQILVWSARSESALRSLAQRHAERFTTDCDAGSFAAACLTAAVGRARFPYRACIVATSAAQAAGLLRPWTTGDVDIADMISGRASGSPEAVFLFTGQGAQYVDMGRELFESNSVFRRAFEQCDQALRDSLQVPLREVVYPEPGERERADTLIDQTAYAQPALFAIEYALSQVWRSWGIEPAAVAGHSVGEFAAAVVAGALRLEDALTLVAARGRLMQKLPSGGAMAAVMAEAGAVEEMLSAFPGVVIAGLNSPANTVVSGPKAAVARMLEALSQRGVEAKRLVVSHAFHSAMIDPVLDDLEHVAGKIRFNTPEVPFFSTLTGEAIDGDELGRASYWRDQARSPVRFTQALGALHRAGHELFLEVGPHATLCGLGAATLDAQSAVFLPSMRRGQPARGSMLRAAGGLFVRGVEPDWRAVIDVSGARTATLPTYPFERTSYWLGWSARAHGNRESAVHPGRLQDGLLWTRDWVRVTGNGRELPAPASLARRLTHRGPELVAKHGGDIYASFLPRLDELCAAYVVTTLRRLGVELRAGAVLQADQLHERAGVGRAHARLLARMHEMLAADGLLAAESEGRWRVLAEPPERFYRPSELLDALLAEYPAGAVEAEMTGRCGERLADVLQGKASAMDVLFPSGSLEFTERLYAETPSFRVFNTLVAEAVAAAARELALLGRRPRILEIGAGTGGTTTRVLPLLRDIACDYAFTDVSPLFLERARRKLAEFGDVSYRLLDIDRDPHAQGFPESAFDIIVASNVLHATPDLGRTLDHVRGLLAPGGLLVILEGLKPQRFGDLTVGMTEGWWSFTDTDLRPDYALLDRDRWLGLLGREGFEDAIVATDPGGDESSLLAQQGLILARAPMSEAKPRPAATRRRWLALARAGEESSSLARALADEGLDLEVLDPAAVDESDTPDACAAMLQGRAGDDTSFGVLHLLSLDECPQDSDSGAEALARQARSTGPALRLAQAAVNMDGIDLVYVTRSAIQVGDEMVDPGGTPLWGLRRSIAAEHPALKCRCIDLPDSWHAAIPALAGWLDENPAPQEDEIVIRDEGSFAARIVPHPAGAPAEPQNFDPSGSYIVTGGLVGLGLRVARWLAERGAGRLVLCGRGAPSDDAGRVLAELQAAGTEIRVVRGDVADPGCIAALLETAGRERLRGVMHCAGVTADATLLRQEWSHFKQVMNAKVAGAWNLHRATQELSGLEHFVLFSTGAAFLGSTGQANHAAANAFLSGLAWHRRATGRPALTIDWGAWTEIGAATRGEVLERARSVGLGALDPETGVQLLDQLMGGATASVAAIVVDWSVFLERHAGLAGRGVFSRVSAMPPGVQPETGAAREAPMQQGALARAVLAAAPGNRREVLFDGLHAEAARALGLSHAESIDPTTPLTELGLDSLMAVELRNALGAKLDRPLPPTLLFTYPTLGELTAHLAQDLLAEDAGRDAPFAGALREEHPAPGELDELDEAALASLLEGKLRPGSPRGNER